MLNRRLVLVVVPAFCEEALIAQVIETMPSFVDTILVIDDGSPDQTSERARATQDPRLVLIRHPQRRGVGAAITTGYLEALRIAKHPHDAIVVMAGDGQMHPDDLETVAMPILRGDADYVKGDRFRDPTVRKKMGLPRFLGGQIFSRLTSLAIGQRISDSQCGFTGISRHALSVIDLPGLWPSFGYPNDLLGQLASFRLRIREVAVRPIYGSEISKLRLRHLPPIFFLLARAAVRRSNPSNSLSPLAHSSNAPKVVVSQTADTMNKELRRDSSVSC